jgi:hypothetical protein
MERVPFIVSAGGLKADGLESCAVLGRLEVGQRVQVAIYQERPSFLSNRFAMIVDLIANARGMRVRNVRGWIAAATGRCDRVDIGGGMALVPWGTGPRDMNGDEFEAFWEDACEFIERVILPTLTVDERATIERLLHYETGGDGRRAAPAPS